MASELMCGACHTAWDLVCGKVNSKTSLFTWIEHCPNGGCDERIWEYVDLKTGNLNPDVPPPEYVPGMPRTEIHKTRRPGPYRKEDGGARRPKKKVLETVPAAPADDGWDTDW